MPLTHRTSSSAPTVPANAAMAAVIAATSSGHDQHESPTLFLTCAAASAAFLGLAIGLFQLDAVCKKILSPESLYARRRREQRFKLDRMLSKAHGVRWKREERDSTKFLYEDGEVEALIDELLVDDGGGRGPKSVGSDEASAAVSPAFDGPSIVAILQDEAELTDRDYYLVLNSQNDTKVQVPLMKFGILMSNKMENIMNTTTMCFVADASSGLGTELLADVMRGSGSGVALIEEPLWMISLAKLIADNPAISKDSLTKVLFALCRMEAWRLRKSAGESRTAVFTLPGQAVTAPLLPLLQRAFPCERHVFVYDSALVCVPRASSTERTKKSARGVTASVALQSMRYTRTMPAALSKLPSEYAATCEAWISSVDTMLKMKEEEQSNGYLPFVLRLQFLTTKNHAANSRFGGLEYDQSKLCLRNVLQYMLGSRSRAIKQSVVDAANCILEDFQLADHAKLCAALTTQQQKDVEACVFAHKGILIADKTLLDTVQPQEKWTLKAAKKMTGCACCAPEEDEDEEEANGGVGATTNLRDAGRKESSAFDTSTSFGLTQRRGGRGKYVDGKVGFAFDPAAFSKPKV